MFIFTWEMTSQKLHYETKNTFKTFYKDPKMILK